MIVSKLISDSAPTATQPDHLYVIIDRSGSMGWTIRKVCQDVVDVLKEASDDTVVSIGWFSSPGDFDWFVFGASLDTTVNRKRVYDVVLNNSTSRATTCFSEILQDAQKRFERDAKMDVVNKMILLTDGCPVVPDVAKEESAIIKALKALQPYFSLFAAVGYGDYYNRELMRQMAQAMGGYLVHANRIETFAEQMKKIVVTRTHKNVKVTIPVGASIAFTVDPDGSVCVKTISDNSVTVPVGQSVFYGTNKPNGKADNSDETKYATALALVQSGNTPDALQQLSDVGDVYLCTLLGSSITDAEFGQAEQAIRLAIASPSGRFIKGKKVGCLPAEDAFDLFDLVHLLTSDPTARFYPYHDAFEYKRVGRKTVTDGDYPSFLAKKETGVPFSSLVWTGDKLNLGLLTKIEGTVEIPANNLGLATPFPTFVWRNYAMIADAKPNILSLPVTVSNETHTKLVLNGLVADIDATSDSVHVLDLTSIPVCNRKKASRAINMKDLAEQAVASELLAAQSKVWRGLMKELDPEGKVIQKTPFTSEQETFLNQYGIKNGAYQPPTKKEPATDHIDIRTFEVKVGGFSSLPKLDDVRVALKSAKKINLPTQAMSVAIHKWDGIQTSLKGLTDKMTWIDTELNGVVLPDQRKKERELNEARMILALTGKWFADAKSRQDKQCTVNVGGQEYVVKFEMGTEQVPI
jgi:hypothetical protein